ncbi:PAS domain S-box protein [Sneathiella sp. P13V-1]|uniref:PAS domain S-box protein n=1 Tax=Sneathiella sp. P13V-1 TaxID=2697366 RepID=UPI00187BA53F|nr:PAS domain S-box protein [Sneathiella sp. P13V-1]MBE7638200.1 PAS domain S-box protein [Sneathiella sp. P13V-1]
MNKNLSTELEHQLSDALESLSEAFVLYDVDGRLVVCNSQFRDLYGYTEEEAAPGVLMRELIQIDIDKRVLPVNADYQDLDKYIQNRFEYMKGKEGHFDAELEDGRIVRIHDRRTSTGGIVSVQRDVTERIRLEKENLRSKELFEAGFNANGSFCSITVLDSGKFLDVNDSWCEISGYSREDAIGNTANDLNIWGNEYNREKLVKEFKERKKLVGFKTQIKRKDGTICSIILNSKVMEVDGQMCLFLSGQDTTEIREAEIALSESNERLAGFTGASTDWYWEQDENRRFTYLSSKVTSSLGLTSSEYIGHTMEEIYNDSSDPGAQEVNRKFTARESFRDIIMKRVHPLTGESVWLQVSGQPFYDKDGEYRGYRGATTDITEKVSLEEHLQQSQKMEAIGQLTGGVAHDFNNLLAVIQGNSEFLEDVIVEEKPELAKHIHAILRAADRGAELTQSMLAFSRKQDLRPTSFMLDERINSMLGIVGRTLGENIEIDTQFEAGLWPCIADAGKLENAFLNMCINSRDAMVKGGKLTIKLENTTLDNDSFDGNYEPGDYVKMSIEDTGTGIKEEDIPHITEPFFTTKEVGKGTGLGLSMVYGFAMQSKGYFDIKSEVDVGTEVSLYLPRA